MLFIRYRILKIGPYRVISRCIKHEVSFRKIHDISVRTFLQNRSERLVNAKL